LFLHKNIQSSQNLPVGLTTFDTHSELTLTSKINFKLIVADKQLTVLTDEKAANTVITLYFINKKITCFASLTGGLFPFKLINCLVSNHEIYKDNDFTGFSFCDSGGCFFPAFSSTNKYTIYSASL
jgi:hypothetical protein